jgi:RecA/RadA recombinase
MTLFNPEDLAKEVEDHALSDVTQEDLDLIRRPISTERVLTTGCTQLDLAICGGRKHGGGIPTGIMAEIFGPTGTGKTLLAVEIAITSQALGGNVRFCDPEGRLDRAYSEQVGLNIQEKFEYHRPDTVSEMFNNLFWPWKPPDPKKINVFGADSLAALSTQMEMEEADKRGQRRAKEFSEGLRKTCRKIANEDLLMVCTNQIRQGDMGYVTPGGMGIPFYASLRIKLKYGKPMQIIKKKKLKFSDEEDADPKEVQKVLGVKTEFEIVKNSIHDPFEKGFFFIIFGYGIDDIRTNLQYMKEKKGEGTYDAIKRRFQSLDQASLCIEAHGLEKELRSRVMETWYRIQKEFSVKRKPKVRHL